MSANEKQVILVVDDDADIRRLIEAALNSLNIESVLCEDGDEAINRLRTQKFDLVILDCLLPKKHGFEVLKELRGLKSKKDLPVIAISGIYKKRLYIEDLINARGANEFLAKPFSIADLLSKVEQYVQTDQADADKGSFLDDMLSKEPLTDDLQTEEEAEETQEDSQGERLADKPDFTKLDVPDRGSIKENPIPEVVKYIFLNRLTCTLKAKREGEKKLILCKEGAIIWAMSNMMRDTLEHIMLAEGSLSLEKYFHFSKRGTHTQKRHGKSYNILETVPQGERKALLRKQMQQIIVDVFSWYDGYYIIDHKLVSLQTYEDINLSTPELIRQGIYGLRHWEILKQGIDSYVTRFVLTEAPPVHDLHVFLSADERHIYELMKKELPLRDILGKTDCTDFVTLQRIYLLNVLGLALKKNEMLRLRQIDAPRTTVTATSQAPPRARARPASEPVSVVQDTPAEQSAEDPTMAAELDAYYQKIKGEKNPLKILGIAEATDKQKAKSSYLRLMKRFHPDRFYGKLNQESQIKLNYVFTTITTSYNFIMEKWEDLAHKQDSIQLEEFHRSSAYHSSDPADDKGLKKQRETIIRNLMIKGRNALKKRDYRAAYSSFRYLLSLEQDNAEYMGYFGLAAFYKKESKMAFDNLMKACEQNAKNPDFYFALGKIYEQRSMLPKAKECFNKALTRDPLHEKSQNALDGLGKKKKQKSAGFTLKGLFKK